MGPIRTQTLPVSKARQNFGELVNQVYKRQARIIIEKNGLPAVALVAISDLERWLSQERQGQTEEQNSGITERPVATGRIAGHAPTKEELIQRQCLVDKILSNAAQRTSSR